MRKNYVLFGAVGLAVTALLIWQRLPGTLISSDPAATDVKAPASKTSDIAPAAIAKDAPTPEPAKNKGNAVTPKPAPARVIRQQPAAQRNERAETSPAPERATPAEAPPLPANDDRAPEAAAADEEPARALLRNREYDKAREVLTAAIDHGGKATFTLIHDHTSGNFEKDNSKATCVGELTLSASEVKFDAPDAEHRFSANWTELRDSGSNKFFGSGIGGFHVTITAGGKYRNFNLAPQSRDKAEATLVLDLLKAYARKGGRTK